MYVIPATAKVWVMQHFNDYGYCHYCNGDWDSIVESSQEALSHADTKLLWRLWHVFIVNADRCSLISGACQLLTPPPLTQQIPPIHVHSPIAGGSLHSRRRQVATPTRWCPERSLAARTAAFDDVMEYNIFMRWLTAGQVTSQA